MLSHDRSRQALTELFQRQPVVDLPILCRALQTASRMSVFRRLSGLGYLSSCSHAGRYYTLPDVPHFDADGLWFYQGILFSRQGTLKATVAHVVEVAADGRTHAELQLQLGLRVHNTLLDLVQAQRLARHTFARQYLYVSADTARAQAQLATRRQQGAGLTSASPASLALATLEILLEVIHASGASVDPPTIAARLRARGSAVTVAQVEQVCQRYALEKKTARCR